MSVRKRLLWICGLLAGIFFCLGFLYSFQLPKVHSWVLVKIKEASETHLPVQVLPTNVRLHLIPLGATFEGVRIQPKPEFKDILDPLVIEELSVELSAVQLAQGRLRLREVSLKGASAVVRLPKAPESSKAPLEGLFNALQKAPISRVKLDGVNLKIDIGQPRVKADIRDIRASAEIRGRKLAIDLGIGSTSVRDQDTNAAIRVELETGMVVDPKSITVSAFKLRRGDSYMIASGTLKGDVEQMKFTDIHLDTRTSLHLESMRNWFVKSFPKFSQVPALRGRANAEAKVRKTNESDPEVEFAFNTEGLYESNFFIDRLKTAGTFKNNSISMPKFEMKNPAGQIQLTGTEIRLPKSRSNKDGSAGPPVPSTVTTTLEVVRADLHEFLKTLGLREEVGVYLDIKAKTPCDGTLSPHFRINCRGTVDAENLFVNEKKVNKGAIAALPKFSAAGEFSFDTRAVTYKTELKMPRSSGRSTGVIEYAKGFNIDYEADVLDMRDKSNLADLRVEGVGKIKGSTEGDSHAATFKMQFEGEDVWFEDYWLGHVKAEVGYKAGLISFNNITGNHATSRYSADVGVDVHKKTVTATARVPFFDTKDLLKAFSRRVKLSFPVTGTGKAEVKVWGPLQFNRLSYDLHSTVFRGTVMRESFDQAHFDVRSRGGEVAAERVMVAREESTITLTGTGHPDGNIKTVIRGRGLRLEDSANVAATGLNLSGLVDFDMDVNGYVLGPATDLRGTIVKSAIGDQGVPDSTFRLRFREHTIEGGGNFLGDLLQTDFILPLHAQAPFRLDLKTQDWNYAPLFGAIAGPGAKKDYDGRLTSVVQLSSASGGFWNSNGTIRIPKFLLRRGALQMSAPEPLVMTMSQGRLQVQNFFLEGDGTFLRAVETAKPVSKLDMQVNGKLDLSLMALMLPFFEELRGLASFAFNLRAGPDNMDLLGSVYLDKGYLKLFNFPHAFEDIRGDFLFNQKKVLINTIKSDFAGGRVSAEGSVELKGPKNYPIQIAAVIDKVNLKIPEGIATQGSGQLFFTGSWFPFQMKGTYDVRSGLVSQLSGGDSSSTGGLQRSNFLPTNILEDNFAPVELDLQVNIPTPIDVKASIPVIDLGVEGRATGKLNIKGPPNRLSLLGSVTTDKESKVIFRDNTFDLTAGVVNFNDPTQINPVLYVTARSRVTGYDVNLVYQGTLKKPDLSLTSTPPLSEPDIMSLLAFGTPGQVVDGIDPRGQTGVGTGSANAATGLRIGDAGLIRNNPAANALKKTTGIDVSASIEDVSNVAVPKVTASRRFTPKFGVSASQSVGATKKTEAKAQYQLSRGVSIVGSWEGQEQTETVDTTGKTQKNQDTFGLDIEYKFEFK